MKRTFSLVLLAACSATHSNGASSTPPDSGSSQGSQTGGTDASTSGSKDSSTTDAFTCTGAGIAAYADQLVTKARTTCTQDGVGVVKMDDYTCMSPAISAVDPPYGSASFNVVSTLLADDTQYPFYECTYFVQTVTAGVCNVPISPSNTPWTEYPFACQFIGATVQGFTWIEKSQGTVQVGDILLYNSSDNCRNDPGHIMIVAEVIDSNHFRIAEANDLTASGSAATGDTGVVSNTRIETLDDPYLASGWFRQGT
jgi:CHAP domain